MSMQPKGISKDEMYPVYHIEEKPRVLKDAYLLSTEFLIRVHTATEEFYAVQDELDNIYKGKVNGYPIRTP